MSVAYRGLVKMHAAEISRRALFRRSGRLTTNEVHQVARDLDALDRKWQLDETIEAILQQADALELERESSTQALA